MVILLACFVAGCIGGVVLPIWPVAILSMLTIFVGVTLAVAQVVGWHGFVANFVAPVIFVQGGYLTLLLVQVAFRSWSTTGNIKLQATEGKEKNEVPDFKSPNVV